ncbi:MAG: ABC transporter permease [Chromatiales bacterium]|jgi:putative ABC transport system permease protein
MNWHTALQLALRALWRNKTRAMLTTLGVVIGVGSVIAMLGIGSGAQQRIAAQLASMGTNSLVIRPGSVTHGGVRTGAGGVSSLTRADANAIAELPDVVAVAPSVRTTEQVRYRGTNWGTAIEGVTPDYLVVRSWPLAEGEFFTARHVQSAAHVCVLGQTVTRELFGLRSPLDESVVVKGLSCQVIGVLTEKGATAWGSDQDDAIFMPITTVQRKLKGITHIERIELEASDREASFRLLKEVKDLLRQRHRLRDEQADDFRMYNRAELAQTSEESARVFTWLLGSIASVSLLVGGIGIMNIMLVSVTERTREIGIRMALGARQRDILWQFLLEALVLSIAGGMLGILLGLGGATAVASFSELPVSVTPGSVLIAFLFAALVGVFFGLHPARKASRLRPIQALRYE